MRKKLKKAGLAAAIKKDAKIRKGKGITEDVVKASVAKPKGKQKPPPSFAAKKPPVAKPKSPARERADREFRLRDVKL